MYFFIVIRNLCNDCIYKRTSHVVFCYKNSSDYVGHLHTKWIWLCCELILMICFFLSSFFQIGPTAPGFYWSHPDWDPTTTTHYWNVWLMTVTNNLSTILTSPASGLPSVGLGELITDSQHGWTKILLLPAMPAVCWLGAGFCWTIYGTEQRVSPAVCMWGPTLVHSAVHLQRGHHRGLQWPASHPHPGEPVQRHTGAAAPE